MYVHINTFQTAQQKTKIGIKLNNNWLKYLQNKVSYL